MRNARLLDDLGKLLDALSDSGISVIVLKGAALLEGLWRNIALRPMADLDILLRERQLERAQTILRNLGYNECATARTPEWYRTSHHHLVPYAQKETGTVVELHRGIVTPQSGATIPAEALWRRSIQYRIAGKETRVLCSDDMLTHLCMHMACDDPFADKARSLADLVLLLKLMGREIDWGKVVSRAETPRMSRALYYPLLLAQERCGSMVSNDVMTDLRKKAGQSKATKVLLRHLMPLGLFKDVPGAGLFPAWVVQRWCETLLSERSFFRKLCALALAFAMAWDPGEEPRVRSTTRLGADILTAPFKFLRRTIRSGRAAEAIGARLVDDHDPKDVPSPVIEVRGLVKRYPQARRYREMLLHPFRKKEITALDGIGLTVERGEVFGLLGPNGAGKTTFVKILATLVLPTEGTVCVEGRNVETDGRQIRQRVGYVVSEERSFYWRLTGRQNLRFYAALNNAVGKRSEDRIEEIMRLVGLRDALDRRFLEYSAGMRQRLAIARGLFTRPRLLLLDEPTRALDPVAARDLRRFIRQDLADRGRTVVLATHNLREAEELCDRVAVLNGGRIVTCGAPDALRR
jgi:ABC-2 type transport system ATP-binding protein